MAGALAGVAKMTAARRSGPGFAAAQGAFDVMAGALECGQVALLFSAGPGYEPAVGVLETLGAYGAPARFFVVGWLAEQSPWLVQSIASWGHVVGSHGYLPPELTSRSDEVVAWDLGAAAGAVSGAPGNAPGPWFTPFAGASDGLVRSIASSLGLVTAGWSVGTGDWDPG